MFRQLMTKRQKLWHGSREPCVSCRHRPGDTRKVVLYTHCYSTQLRPGVMLMMSLALSYDTLDVVVVISRTMMSCR